MKQPRFALAQFPWVTLLTALLLALHAWLAVSATTHFCTTSDEIVHVTAGYSYWKFNDYRLQPENGNLPQRWTALPLLAQALYFPNLQSDDWGSSEVWRTGFKFFYREGNSVDYMLLCARAAMVVWSMATGLLVFLWAKSIWGDAGGLFSLCLYAFCPNFLAHGPLATSDVIMVFFLLAATGAWWRHSRRLSWGSWLLSGAVLGLACVAKFSAVLLLPVFTLLLLVRTVDRQPIAFAPGRRHYTLKSWSPKLATLAASSLTQAFIAWIIIWAFYDFRYSAANSALPKQLDFYPPWASVIADHPPLSGVAQAFSQWHLLPQAFLFGFDHVMHFSQGRGGFLNNAYSNTGWWYFFPYAFLVKTPPATLLAFTFALVLAVWHWWPHQGSFDACLQHVRRDLYRVTPLLVLFIVYWAFSLASHLNIGHRHILPVYPPLFIAAGLIARPGAGWRWRAPLALLLALGLAVSSFGIRPTYLAYFNCLAGGPDQGYQHLVDSSLDWGQDLPALSAWLHTHRRPDEPVYLAYFGNGDPAYYGISAYRLAPYSMQEQWKHWQVLSRGLYCVSATMLQDVYSEWRGPWNLAREWRYHQLLLKYGAQAPPQLNIDSDQMKEIDRLVFARLCLYLRVRRPDALINHTFFVFRLSADELKPVLTGTIHDLNAAIELAYRARHASGP